MRVRTILVVSIFYISSSGIYSQSLETELGTLKNALDALRLSLQGVPVADTTLTPPPPFPGLPKQPTSKPKISGPKSEVPTGEKPKEKIEKPTKKPTGGLLGGLTKSPIFTKPSAKKISEPKKQKKAAAKIKELTKDTKLNIGSIGFKFELKTYIPESLEGMAKPQRELSRSNAEIMLEKIAQYVESNLPKAKQKKENLKSYILQVITINPSLISMASPLLQKIGYPKDQLYNLMVSLYKDHVVSIAKTIGSIIGQKQLKKLNERKDIYRAFQDTLTKSSFNNILNTTRKELFAQFEGLRDDIDDALSYPIALQGIIEKSQRDALYNDDTAAKDFIQNIEQWGKNLRKILELLKGNKKLEKIGISIDNYLQILEGFQATKNRLRCIFDETKKEYAGKKYIHLYEDFNAIINAIEAYNKNKNQYTHTQKLAQIQRVINRLQAYYDFTQATNICLRCYQADIGILHRGKGWSRMEPSFVSGEDALALIKKGDFKYIKLPFTLKEAEKKIDDFFNSLSEESESIKEFKNNVWESIKTSFNTCSVELLYLKKFGEKSYQFYSKMNLPISEFKEEKLKDGYEVLKKSDPAKLKGVDYTLNYVAEK